MTDKLKPPLRVRWEFVRAGVSRKEFEKCLYVACDRHYAQLLGAYQMSRSGRYGDGKMRGKLRNWKAIKDEMKNIMRCGCCSWTKDVT
jgi:hypothetical protein